MILTILDQNYQFENSESGTEQLIKAINDTLTNENLFFSHLVIDGQEIYENHEDYILEHLEHIGEIKVVTNTIQEFVDNLLISLNDYTKRGIPEIEKLVDDFYQIPSEHSWNTLNELLEGIDWIYETIKAIDRTVHKITNWNEFIKTTAIFEVELPNLLEALENKDSILIADIIQYEILPQFRLIHDLTEQSFQEKLK